MGKFYDIMYDENIWSIKGDSENGYRISKNGTYESHFLKGTIVGIYQVANNSFLIYYLCGSKNKDILIIVFGTLMVILSFGSFIGLGLFGITFSRLVEFNIISNLPFRNYFSIFLWIYIVLSVFSVLFGIQSSNMKFEKNQKENI